MAEKKPNISPDPKETDKPEPVEQMDLVQPEEPRGLVAPPFYDGPSHSRWYIEPPRPERPTPVPPTNAPPVLMTQADMNFTFGPQKFRGLRSCECLSCTPSYITRALRVRPRNHPYAKRTVNVAPIVIVQQQRDDEIAELTRKVKSCSVKEKKN